MSIDPVDTQQAPPLLQIQGLDIGFGRGRPDWRGRAAPTGEPVVKSLDLDIAAQSVVALVGESGSGKSATAMAIMDLLPPSAWLGPHSRIRFDGQDLLAPGIDRRHAVRGRDVAMIFQEPMSSLNPVFTVGFQLAEVLRLHQGLDATAARRQAVMLLDQVGIAQAWARVDAYPTHLSGGQQQRVMIAMAMACRPRLLIADEPTTALDVTVQKQIIELLAQLRREYGMAMLFITHDLALVGEVAEQVVVMRQGEVLERGSLVRVFGQPAHPYTRSLLTCRPGMRAPGRHLQVVGGTALPAAPREARILPLHAVAPKPALLEARGLAKSFWLPGRWRRVRQPALQDVSLRLERGRTLGVVGESGSGKSTLAATLLRLLPADAGQVLMEGDDILALREAAFAPYRRRLQIVFQNPYASLNPRFTVEQILTEPMHIHGLGADADARRAQALQLLAKVGLPSTVLGRHAHQFSGGQRQRLAIARCLAVSPEVLVCDESVSALDVSVQAQILDLLAQLQEEEGLSYLFISHDLGVISQIADEVMVMQQGRVVESGPAASVLRQPQQAYTRALLASVPKGLRR